MSSNPQRDLYTDAIDLQQNPGTDGATTLRHIAAERLAAHRSRRAVQDQPATVVSGQRAATSISDSARRAREAVAARYSTTPSYREILAAEPRPADPQSGQPGPAESQAVARPAAVAAAAVAPQPAPTVSPVIPPLTTPAEAVVAQAGIPVPAAAAPLPLSMPEGALQVRPFEALPQLITPPAPQRFQQTAPAAEIEGLDDEIAFRLAPEFAEHLIEPLPIQANIIEFPRQLVAARKARPRLAEGPLRSDDAMDYRDTAPAAADAHLAADALPSAEAEQGFQMRIFEVDPAYAESASSAAAHAVQTALAAPQPPVVPEWQHLVLDAAEEEDNAPSWVPAPTPEMPLLPAHAADGPLPVASMELRFMSFVVDTICVGAAFVSFAAVAGWLGGQQLRAVPLPTLGIASAAMVGLMAVFYQALFFTLSHSTPGMFYTNLVFKTLAGREPSRRMLRRRVGANVIAVLPLGLGLLWSIVDKRSLGWNDRISGVFLREY